MSTAAQIKDKATRYDFSKVDKTYATPENAAKAFEKQFGHVPVHYIIHATEDGRFTPVALGRSAMDYGIHAVFPILVLPA